MFPLVFIYKFIFLNIEFSTYGALVDVGTCHCLAESVYLSYLIEDGFIKNSYSENYDS